VARALTAKHPEMADFRIITVLFNSTAKLPPGSCGAGGSGVFAGVVRGGPRVLVCRRTSGRLWEVRGSAAAARATGLLQCVAERPPRGSRGQTRDARIGERGPCVTRTSAEQPEMFRVLHRHLAAVRHVDAAAVLRSGRSGVVRAGSMEGLLVRNSASGRQWGGCRAVYATQETVSF
jgi:hypothetical protein